MYVDPKNKNTILLISSLHTFICILQYFIMVSGGGSHTHNEINQSAAESKLDQQSYDNMQSNKLYFGGKEES